MDIHKPKAAHSWREFLIEIGTIICGILIALGLEQGVEWLHKEEKAGRSEHAMRIELAEDDGVQAFARVALAQCFLSRLDQIREKAVDASGEQLRVLATAYNPPFRVWDNEAWKTVASSDVANFIGAERLVAWSSPYRLIPLLNETSSEEAKLVVELHEAVPPAGEPSMAQRLNLRRTAALLRLNNRRISRASELFLSRIRGLDALTPAATQELILKRAHAVYGDCVVTPQPGAAPAAASIDSQLVGLAN